MESRIELIEVDGRDPEAITVVRHISDDLAATLRDDLAAVAAAFHVACGDDHDDQGAKFDIGVAMAVAAIDELARDHTPRKGDR